MKYFTLKMYSLNDESAEYDSIKEAKPVNVPAGVGYSQPIKFFKDLESVKKGIELNEIKASHFVCEILEDGNYKLLSLEELK